MTRADLQGLRILVAEDEYLLADDLRGALIDAGVEVVGPVPSVAEAAALISTETALDAALLDVNLRGEMVFAIADTLEVRGIPFAFVTGYGLAAIPGRYAHVTVLEKPIRPEQITELAATSLTRRAGLADGTAR